MEDTDFINKARRLVFDYIKDRDLRESFEITDIFVVSYGFIHGHWKAVVGTPVPDVYYEVTHKPEHDGTDGPEATYLDVYKKIVHVRLTNEVDRPKTTITFNPNPSGRSYNRNDALNAIRVRSGG